MSIDQDFFHIEVDSPGCSHCGASKSWMIIGLDEVACSVVYLSLEHAEEDCDALNNAVHRAFAYARIEGGETA